jgi:hypothetical protein
MLIIKHRVNSKEELIHLNPEFGAEIDVRTFGDKIVVSHDPFNSNAPLFEQWIKSYKHKTLIINVKEEGLEPRIKDIMSKYPIIDFIFLDQSFPFLIKGLRENDTRTALRFSNFESIENLEMIVNELACKPNWLWIDDFIGRWSHIEHLKNIDLTGIRTCVVSPELHGRTLELEGIGMKKIFESFSPTAICTKNPEFWLSND